MKVDSVSAVSLHRQRLSSMSMPGLSLSFGARKMMNQILSMTPEHNGLGLSETSQGGEGVVAFEAPASMNRYEGMDVRSVMPFWSHDNPQGGYKFLIHKGELADTMPAKAFYSAMPGETIEQVASKFGVKVSDISYVVQSRPNGVGPEAQSKYCILEPTSVKGEISRLSDNNLGEMKRVPYQLFKISEKNPSYNRLKGGNDYFIWTPELAKASKPYAYDTFGSVPFEAEINNADWCRVMAEVFPNRMNTEEFGYFRPANYWAQDRPAQTFLYYISNDSAEGKESARGLKIHGTHHNTGEYYQGTTDDWRKFIRIVATESDVEELKKMPDFEILNKAYQYGMDALSPREQKIVRDIIDPYMANFKDASGKYNILKMAIAGARINPQNESVGTVSYTFAQEMKDPNLVSVARNLTDDYASIETKDVLNGSTPANLRLNDPTAGFGRGGNGLSLHKEGFTTFQYDGTNIEQVVAAREKNAKWLSNLIYEAGEKGELELKKLFFNEGQIHDGHSVLGYISPIKDGDMLVMGWGRADEQKGFTITLEGFLDFLKRKDIPTSEKLKVKVITGGGPWSKDAPDYKNIVRILKEIGELEGGIYKHNAMYVDGFFPNRLVGCSTHGMFTSRREMCGITPLEAKAAGSPYAVTRTGGPVDYTNASNGFVTKHAVELNPEYFGLSWNDSAQAIDDARVKAQAPQISDIFKEMLEEYRDHRDSYIAKCKKNIEEKIDWHNNSEYNRGMSANECYKERIFEVSKGYGSRYKGRMKRTTGSFGQTFKESFESVMGQSGESTSSSSSIFKSIPKQLRFPIAIVVGCIAVASGVILIASSHRHKKALASKGLDKVA